MPKKKVVLPVLSEQGWVEDINKDMLAYLVSYYILSDAAQTISFQSNIINLPETYYKYINDPEGMANAVKEDLDKLLSYYYITVDVDTRAKEVTRKKYAILIYVAVINSESKKFELSRVVEITSTGLRKIIEVNNFGDGMNILNSI